MEDISFVDDPIADIVVPTVKFDLFRVKEKKQAIKKLLHIFCHNNLKPYAWN